MRFRIWGCRGSLAAPGPETVRYGGNTSCVELRLGDGSVLVLDAGTGIRDLGRKLDREGARVIHVLLSHLHMDHLQGLAFFQPLWTPGVQLHIWGPPSPLHALEERIAMYMSPPLFPINLSDVPARCVFHDAEEEWKIGTAEIYAGSVSHQGPTVGYRVEEGGRSLAYLPDHEPSLGTDLRSVEAEWISGHDVAAGVDVLLHDSQYTEDEYPRHVGWGHSSIEQVVTFGLKAAVNQLVLFHHDPFHTDDDLDTIGTRAAELWGAGERGRPVLAHEGMEMDVAPAHDAGRRSLAADAPR